MDFDVVYLESGPLNIGCGGVNGLLQRSGFAGKVDKHFAVAADDSPIITASFKKSITLIACDVSDAHQDQFEVVRFHHFATSGN